MTWPFLFVAALYALHPVTVSVYPAVALSSPTTMFRITVMVPRHEENRKLCLGYRVTDERELIRNSCQSMDGLLAVRTRTVYWEVRAAGEYEAVADLTRMEAGKERHYLSLEPFRVIGMDQ